MNKTKVSPAGENFNDYKKRVLSKQQRTEVDKEYAKLRKKIILKLGKENEQEKPLIKRVV
jgi:hypothetical protein